MQLHPGVQLAGAKGEKIIKKKGSERKRKNAYGQTKGRSDIPGSGIHSDWSILTGFVMILYSFIMSFNDMYLYLKLDYELEISISCKYKSTSV